jgi:S-(hydroxymethyl)glutathione dehydrogenase/alcohol dehydrogenase
MRAAVCREFGSPLSVEDISLGEVGPTDVHVAVAACAVCHSDIHFAEGAWGGFLPAVYGHEAAGVVTAVGTEVDGVAPGDHVVVTLIRSCGSCSQCERGNHVFCETTFASDASERLSDVAGEDVQAAMFCGAFAEEVIVDQSQVVVVPDDLDMAVASLLACGVITGVGAVTNTSTITDGSTVVVVGAGGVGLNAIQGAAIVGAAVIIAIDLAEEKLEIAKEFGATHAATPETARQVIKEATGGRKGVSHALVTVGSAPAIRSALRYIEPGGELVIVGMTASGQEIDIDPVIVAAAGHRIIGSKMGTSQIRRDIPQLIAWYREGRLKLDELVSDTYRLDDINEAIADVSNGAVIRNIVLMD